MCQKYTRFVLLYKPPSYGAKGTGAVIGAAVCASLTGGIRLRHTEQKYYSGGMSPKSKLGERIPVLNDYIRKNGRAPTLEELCTLFNVRSKNTASILATKAAWT